MNTITTEEEGIEEIRDDMELRIKGVFIGILGEAAIVERTETVRDNNPNRMGINQVYSFFWLHYKPERSKFYTKNRFLRNHTKIKETGEIVWA